MQLTTKQALINYLEFLKESGYLYAEGVTPEQPPPARAAAGAAALAAAPKPGGAAAVASASARKTPEPSRPAPQTSGTPSITSKSTSAAAPGTNLTLPPPTGPSLTREERLARLEDGRLRAEACRACPLGSQRTQAVYYDGDPMARIVFIGEAPGANEDQQGKPFVGAAGQLLNKMITAIGFKREEVFICNTLKCRPPQNRDPKPEEKAACEPFLIEQLAIVRPQMIVALGAHAAHYLCRTEEAIGRLRGRWHSYQGIPVLVTYHPSFLLQKEGKPDAVEFKKRSWQDFQMLHARYCELNPDDPRQIWTKKEKPE